METSASPDLNGGAYDSSLGHSLQDWRFESAAVISIGRAEDCDVAISDPYVSRLHAELRLRGSQWWLLSRGQHGVHVEGQNVAEVLLHDGLVFRLGSSGPLVQFLTPRPPDQTNQATAEGFDLQELAGLQIDEAGLSREVREIAEGDYFQQLQTQASVPQSRPSHKSNRQVRERPRGQDHLDALLRGGTGKSNTTIIGGDGRQPALSRRGRYRYSIAGHSRAVQF
jgi:pSer/pThr/pTyr-binding forkhead associated (FHA) protein